MRFAWPAPLGDRRAVVATVDEGGEIGHVHHQPGQSSPYPLTMRRPARSRSRAGRPRTAGPPPPRTVDGPAPPAGTAPTADRPWWPTSRQAQLRARRHHPVGGRQRKIGAHRHASVERRRTTASTTPATSSRSNTDHTAARSPNCLCWLRTGEPSPSRQAGQHLLGGAQVLLRDDPRQDFRHGWDYGLRWPIVRGEGRVTGLPA